MFLHSFNNRSTTAFFNIFRILNIVLFFISSILPSTFHFHKFPPIYFVFLMYFYYTTFFFFFLEGGGGTSLLDAVHFPEICFPVICEGPTSCSMFGLLNVKSAAKQNRRVPTSSGWLTGLGRTFSCLHTSLWNKRVWISRLIEWRRVRFFFPPFSCCQASVTWAACSVEGLLRSSDMRTHWTKSLFQSRHRHHHFTVQTWENRQLF